MTRSADSVLSERNHDAHGGASASWSYCQQHVLAHVRERPAGVASVELKISRRKIENFKEND